MYTKISDSTKIFLLNFQRCQMITSVISQHGNMLKNPLQTHVMRQDLNMKFSLRKALSTDLSSSLRSSTLSEDSGSAVQSRLTTSFLPQNVLMQNTSAQTTRNIIRSCFTVQYSVQSNAFSVFLLKTTQALCPHGSTLNRLPLYRSMPSAMTMRRKLQTRCVLQASV